MDLFRWQRDGVVQDLWRYDREVRTRTGTPPFADGSQIADFLWESSFTDKQRVTKSITLGHADTIKVSLTAKEGSKAKRPHQAFLVIKEASGLEAPFPLTVKDSGKGTVEIVRNCPRDAAERPC